MKGSFTAISVCVIIPLGQYENAELNLKNSISCYGEIFQSSVKKDECEISIRERHSCTYKPLTAAKSKGFYDCSPSSIDVEKGSKHMTAYAERQATDEKQNSYEEDDCMVPCESLFKDHTLLLHPKANSI